MSALVSIYLDKRQEKQEEYYPVKLRVTYARQRKYYGIEAGEINKLLVGPLSDYKYDGRNYSMKSDDYNSIQKPGIRGKLKSLQLVLKGFEAKYQQIANSISPFSFDKFTAQYHPVKQTAEIDIYAAIRTKIETLREEQRFTTAVTYTSTLKSFKDHFKKKRLPFDEITPSTLQKYSRWMKEKGKSDTTTGIYLRNLRCIFNDAIANGLTTNYPFSNRMKRNGFKIPAPKGRKLALTSEELKVIFGHECAADHPGRFYFDSWKLMYLMQGINPKDLCLLKYSDINDKVISFTRAKTKDSQPTTIDIPVNTKIDQIIKTWGNPVESKNYIWPVITTPDPEKQIKLIAQFVKMVNHYITQIAFEIKIAKPITCYTARHSYATMLMRHGAPVAFISKSLGHTSTKTTDAYLSSFDVKQKIKWQKKLTDFDL